MTMGFAAPCPPRCIPQELVRRPGHEAEEGEVCLHRDRRGGFVLERHVRLVPLPPARTVVRRGWRRVVRGMPRDGLLCLRYAPLVCCACGRTEERSALLGAAVVVCSLGVRWEMRPARVDDGSAMPAITVQRASIWTRRAAGNPNLVRPRGAKRVPVRRTRRPARSARAVSRRRSGREWQRRSQSHSASSTRPCQSHMRRASAPPGLGSPLPHLHRDRAHPATSAPGPGSPPVTSTP